jgi:hypothetical protein
MKFIFQNKDKSNWGDLQKNISDEICQKLKSGDDFFVQVLTAKPVKDVEFPNVFFFRQGNPKLAQIKANLGKEISRKIGEPNFDDFKILIAPASAPSDNQRAYYFGVVLPAIQEYFMQQGDFMGLSELDENIRGAIAEEFGLVREEINKITGEVEKRRLTLSNAGTKVEVRKYIDAVLIWAARDYGINIPSLSSK